MERPDTRRDLPRLAVPVYVLDGEAELTARRDLMLAWFDQLEAPIKRRYCFPDAAHAVAFEEFEALQRIMTETVLPETYPVATQPVAIPDTLPATVAVLFRSKMEEKCGRWTCLHDYIAR